MSTIRRRNSGQEHCLIEPPTHNFRQYLDLQAVRVEKWKTALSPLRTAISAALVWPSWKYETEKVWPAAVLCSVPPSFRRRIVAVIVVVIAVRCRFAEV